MPFKSEAQRRWMYATHPEMAKQWSKETPKGKKLPKKITDSDPKQTIKDGKKAKKRLEKAADALSALQRARQWAQNTARTLGGTNIDDVAGGHYQEALQMPVVKSFAKDYPGAMGATEGFIDDAIRGVREVPWAEELPRQSKGRLDLINKLEEAAAAVGAEKAKTKKYRGIAGAAVATPIVGAGLAKGLKKDKEKTKLSEEQKNKLKQVAKQVAPAAAAAYVGTAPITHGLRTGALGASEDTGKSFKNIDELRKNMKPGDVMFTSSPGRGGKYKPVISALGGDPFGYHVEVVSRAGKGKKQVGSIHATPGEGGATERVFKMVPEEDIVIRRMKKPEHAKEMLKNVKQRALEGDVLEDLLGEQARATTYDAKRATKAGLKSLLPESLAKLLENKPAQKGMAVCSSLPGMASPVCVTPGVRGEDILPHHIRRSKAFETIGSYRAPRNFQQMAFERALQAAPWLIRGGIGAGLGYGAYRGVKALVD